MIKFDIKSSLKELVIFTAEIKAEESENYGVKLGLAVKAAVKARANLARANLSSANLSRAYLDRANLAGADLADADLADADLAGANLAGANLAGANLAGADLNGVSGLNDWIKCIQVEDWPISYTSEVIQIGCQRHSIDAWRNFSDAEIREMDGMRALNFWRKWKGWIFQAIEMAPAKPTKAAEPAKTEPSHDR